MQSPLNQGRISRTRATFTADERCTRTIRGFDRPSAQQSGADRAEIVGGDLLQDHCVGLFEHPVADTNVLGRITARERHTAGRYRRGLDARQRLDAGKPPGIGLYFT